MVGLGDLSGGSFSSFARAVTPDGSIVVGEGHTASGTEAFLWTELTGMTGMGFLAGGGGFSQALGVSADGSTVVGISDTAALAPAEAFVWTEANGMQRLFDVLVANGATGLSGWVLLGATGISADGSRIVGYANNPLGQTEAFLADITPVPIPAAVWLFASSLGALRLIRRRTAVP
jgi:uncharacterized membrane protein